MISRRKVSSKKYEEITLRTQNAVLYVSWDKETWSILQISARTGGRGSLKDGAMSRLGDEKGDLHEQHSQQYAVPSLPCQCE